jgi:hypothetical protein
MDYAQESKVLSVPYLEYNPELVRAFSNYKIVISVEWIALNVTTLLQSFLGRRLALVFGNEYFPSRRVVEQAAAQACKERSERNWCKNE